MIKPVLCHIRTTKAEISLRAFVVRCLDSIIYVAKSKISKLASVAEQTGLSVTCSETPEDRFSRRVAQVEQRNSPNSGSYPALFKFLARRMMTFIFSICGK